MDVTSKQEEQEWLKEQVEEFIKILPSYRIYARVLQTVLDKAVKRYMPLAIVKTRSKSIASFGEKALLKKHVGRYSDPVNRMTDLCGGRIIVPTKAEVGVISEFIENHFEIDSENSVDVSKKLKPSEFGYRGVHYIVQFKPNVFPTRDVDVEIPKEIFGLRAEIQVKTILEHAWGVFTHDRAYKGAFKIPEKWEREMAALAAILEDADSSFARVEDGLKRYAASYGAYMTEEKMREQIKNLKIILAYDPKNIELAARIGKLAITLGDWPTAIKTLTKYINSGHSPILRDLGVAICKLYRNKPDSKKYRQGQEYLEAAIAANPKDTDAISSLAGTYKGIDEEKARELYRRAFEVDPSDTYPLGNYIEYETACLQDTSIVLALRPVIDTAIQRCRDQADVGMNLPWAFYDIGKFYLLRGMPYESLTAYAKAVQLSTASFMIETSRASLDRLTAIKDKLPGYEWARRLLLVGQAAKFPDKRLTKELKSLASAESKPIPSPVVIVAGGSDVDTKQQIQGYRRVILDGFKDFRGAVVSGGTASGVSRLVGEIGERYPDVIQTIGYIPHTLPAGIRKDSRYSEIRRTGGDSFSPLEPLQYWIDIITSGISPSKVKLLGINGSTISAAEYRMALALGAQVAVLEGSGGEAANLVSDDDWVDSKGLLRLPADAMTVAAFLGGAAPAMEPDIRKIIGQAIHENYRAAKIKGSRIDDPAMASWEKLPDMLKESNLQQADDIFNKLRRIGCTAAKAEGRKVAKITFTRDEIEVMAEMEHARWNVERLLDGWKWGMNKDVGKKTSPYLVGWADLPEDVKEWDRVTVCNIPEFLAKVGLEIQREYEPPWLPQELEEG
jgi:ppGpp synthetase/RelA/SpoT-type nucleotidyltranferase